MALSSPVPYKNKSICYINGKEVPAKITSYSLSCEKGQPIKEEISLAQDCYCDGSIGSIVPFNNEDRTFMMELEGNTTFGQLVYTNDQIDAYTHSFKEHQQQKADLLAQFTEVLEKMQDTIKQLKEDQLCLKSN